MQLSLHGFSGRIYQRMRSFAIGNMPYTLHHVQLDYVYILQYSIHANNDLLTEMHGKAERTI
jgi:hypothetical protein